MLATKYIFLWVINVLILVTNSLRLNWGLIRDYTHTHIYIYIYIPQKHLYISHKNGGILRVVLSKTWHQRFAIVTFKYILGVLSLIKLYKKLTGH